MLTIDDFSPSLIVIIKICFILPSYIIKTLSLIFDITGSLQISIARIVEIINDLSIIVLCAILILSLISLLASFGGIKRSFGQIKSMGLEILNSLLIVIEALLECLQLALFRFDSMF